MYTSVCYKDDYNTFKYHKYEDQNPDINMCTVKIIVLFVDLTSKHQSQSL